MIGKLKWPLLISGLLAITGCVEDDPYDRPAEARDIVSDAQLEEFEEAGIEIHGGPNQPSIAGTYFFDDSMIIEHNTSDTWPGPNPSWCETEQTFHATDRPDLYTTSYVYTECDGSGEGDASYISGEGNCFTLYSTGSGTFEGCYQESIGVFSACLSENGDFLNPKSGNLTTDTENSEDCETVINEGRTTATGDLTVVSREIAPLLN